MIFDYKKIPNSIEPYKVLNYKEIQDIENFNVDLKEKNLYREMKQLGWRMTKTCLVEQGVGLAAPQVGIFKNVFLIIGFLKPHVWQFDGQFHMCINPTFKPAKNTEYFGFQEGCLSVPGELYTIERPREVLVEYWYFDNKKRLKKNTEKLEGFPARVFQHEFDHLLGTNIVEISAQQTKKKTRKRKVKS